MIIIKSEEGHIVEVFDTAKEFKYYIDEYLQKMEKGMNEDKLLEERNRMLLEIPLDKAGFTYKLNSYLDITNDKVEFV